ncbi:Adenylate cyclase [Diplonema papillatum]|nr:Adenylate cyclase [Diplonema papillatum]
MSVYPVLDDTSLGQSTKGGKPAGANRAAGKPKKAVKVFTAQVGFPTLAFIAIACVVVFSMVTITATYNDALDDTNARGVSAVADAVILTADINRDNAITLQATVTDVTCGLVKKILGAIEKQVSSFSNYILLDPLLRLQPKNSTDFILQTRFEAYNAYLSSSAEISVPVWVTTGTGNAAYGFSVSSAGVVKMLVNDATATQFSSYSFDEDMEMTFEEVVAGTSTEQDVMGSLGRDGTIKPNETMWVKEAMSSDVVAGGLACISVMEDPVSGALLSVRAIVSPKFLSDAITGMDLGASDEDGIRIFGVFRSTELLSRLSPTDWRYTTFESLHTLSFSSHGEVSVEVDLPPPGGKGSKFYVDTNAPDDVMRAAAAAVHAQPAGYAGVASATHGVLLADLQVDGKNVSYIIQVDYLTMDHPGADHYVVMCTPTVLVVGDVDAGIADLVALIAKSRADLDDDIQNEVLLITVISIIVAVVIFLVLTLSTLRAARPLRQLQKDMASVAEMKLDQVDMQLSYLREIRSMQVSFATMIKNLKEFKAYVPASVLNRSDDQLVGPARPPTGIVSFVFTDIENSTALWEKSARDMDSALEMHNEIMREAIKSTGGYEVKTIGDAFMVAFEQPVQALQFCFEAQQGLFQAKWPSDLDLPCEMKYGKMKRWLPVRMGAHYGPALLEQNPITGRSDYRGGVVNTAARVESKAKPGTVCISDNFFRAVKDEVSRVNGDLSGTFMNHGIHNLKGLGDTHLFLVTPAAFKDRLFEEYTVVEVEERRNSLDTTHTKQSTSSKSDIAPSKRTGLFLQQLEGTIALCRLLDMSEGKIFDACNQVVRCSVDAAALTDGAVLTLCGNNLLVTWNTSRPCRMHATAALQFAGELKRRCRSAIVRVGITTGAVSFGNVGTVSKRFSTVMGKCVTVAALAADLCVRFNTFCLVGDFTTANTLTTKPNVSALLRLVDIWLDVSTDRKVNLYQLVTSKLENLESMWEALDDADNVLHDSLYKEAIAGSEPAIDKLREMAEGDATLQVVVSNLVVGAMTPGSQYRTAIDLSCPFMMSEQHW